MLEGRHERQVSFYVTEEEAESFGVFLREVHAEVFGRMCAGGSAKAGSLMRLWMIQQVICGIELSLGGTTVSIKEGDGEITLRYSHESQRWVESV